MKGSRFSPRNKGRMEKYQIPENVEDVRRSDAKFGFLLNRNPSEQRLVRRNLEVAVGVWVKMMRLKDQTY